MFHVEHSNDITILIQTELPIYLKNKLGNRRDRNTVTRSRFPTPDSRIVNFIDKHLRILFQSPSDFLDLINRPGLIDQNF